MKQPNTAQVTLQTIRQATQAWEFLTECGGRISESSFVRAYQYSDYIQHTVARWQHQIAACEYLQSQLPLWLEIFDDLDESASSMSASWLAARLNTIASKAAADSSLDEMMLQIRVIRQLFQVRAIYREVQLAEFGLELRQARFVLQMQEYSEFADQVIKVSLALMHAQQVEKWHLTTTPTPMAIFALGKHGAGELNLSSDVDLIFAFDGTVELAGSDKGTSQFYLRLGQRLIRFLNDITADGIVFRIDMRLRPFGQSGALVWSASALEAYYEQQGRMWERFAWVKGRAITGGEFAQQLHQRLQPFVFRRYLDYTVVAALREMKALIQREIKRKDSMLNIKLGLGGIREVEFVVQVFQLISGGRLPELCTQSLLGALQQCVQQELLPRKTAQNLRADYLLMRWVEHLLQAQNDQQTQLLPQNEAAWQRLASAMCWESVESLQAQITQARDRVHINFLATVRTPEDKIEESYTTHHWGDYWLSAMEYPPQTNALSEQTQPQLQALLKEFKYSKQVNRASEVAADRLNLVMPMVLAILDQQAGNPAMSLRARLSHQTSCSLEELDVHWAGFLDTLSRVLRVLEGVVRRPSYLSMLAENPQAIERLIIVCGMSEHLAELVASHPILLEELVQRPIYARPPEREALIDEMRQHLVRLPEDDFEQQMNTLRAFKHRHTLRVAIADLQGQLPLMQISDYLTWLAEALLQAALDIAWRKLTLKYGEPTRAGDGIGFLIVGYGKLGGIELSYTSDLDIVCLYDGASQGETDGRRSIDNGVFYIQLVQYLSHLLMTDTLDGRLYEIDLRLRPSGNSGLFVSTLEGFARYQQQEAWVWERQALVRARPVAGDVGLFDRFSALRCASLTNDRADDDLRSAVPKMKQRMQQELSKSSIDFDLKYGDGGLVDIEFIAQYLALEYGKRLPALLRYTDNVRIFEAAVQAQLLSAEQAEQLIEAYLSYRSLIHRLSLQRRQATIQNSYLKDVRCQVRRVWQQVFGDLV